MLLELPDQLRSTVNHLPAQKLEFYRRSWLFVKVFEHLVPASEADATRKAISRLVQSAFMLNKEPALLIADALEGNFKLPEFMETYAAEWMAAVRYLAYGDVDLELELSNEIRETAKQKAKLMWAQEMEDLLSSSP